VNASGHQNGGPLGVPVLCLDSEERVVDFSSVLVEPTILQDVKGGLQMIEVFYDVIHLAPALDALRLLMCRRRKIQFRACTSKLEILSNDLQQKKEIAFFWFG